MFSSEFYEISKNTFFTEHLWTTVSEAAVIKIKKQPSEVFYKSRF